MSLENLLKIGQLKPHPFDQDEVDRLLAAAQRNLREANETPASAPAMTHTIRPLISVPNNYVSKLFYYFDTSN